jgi:hypothetical protein
MMRVSGVWHYVFCELLEEGGRGRGKGEGERRGWGRGRGRGASCPDALAHTLAHTTSHEPVPSPCFSFFLSFFLSTFSHLLFPLSLSARSTLYPSPLHFPSFLSSPSLFFSLPLSVLWPFPVPFSPFPLYTRYTDKKEKKISLIY